MTQTTFASNAAPSETLLDQNFTQLYDLRELVSTPSYVAATPKVKIDAGANILSIGGGGIGYGVGSGGSVTQITSKGTAVTLNKVGGSITTTADSLAAGAVITFGVSNSSWAATDTMVCHVVAAANGAQNYNVFPFAGGIAGGLSMALKNISGGALAEAVTISFAIIKSITS